MRELTELESFGLSLLAEDLNLDIDRRDDGSILIRKNQETVGLLNSEREALTHVLALAGFRDPETGRISNPFNANEGIDDPVLV